VRDGLVNERGQVSVRVLGDGGGHRHGGPDDGASDGTDGEVVGASSGAFGHGAGKQLHGLGDLVEHGRAQPGDGEGEGDALLLLGTLLCGQAGEGHGERRAQGRDRGQLGRLGVECRDEPRVIFVVEDQVLLRGEVAEEGGLRDIGGLDDLLDRGGVIALLTEQAQGAGLDRGPGPGLLAFPQSRPAGTGACAAHCGPPSRARMPA